MTQSSAAPPQRLRRVAIASCAGTTIEFYDFFIYGTATALVFPTIFFPELGGANGTLASFATFAVAFFARPVGSVVFGHYGDRIGRKRTLIVTLLMMGIATVLIGLLPGTATLGIAAPIILVVLRFVQGFAVGGEWAGATLLAAEYAPPGRRGRYAMFPQLGPAIAFFLSSGTFALSGLIFGFSDEVFLNYGWRVPFIASILLVGVGLYVRLKIAETPAFERQRERAASAPSTGLPFAGAVRSQWQEILLGAGASTLFFAFFYMGTAFFTKYGGGQPPDGPGLDQVTILTLGMVAAVFFAGMTILSAILSDRLGRRRMILLANGLAIPWAFALFPILSTGAVGFAIGLTGTLMIFAIAYGPAGAYLPELFETRYRYTGAGLSYNLAGVLGGGIPPIVATGLLAAYGGIGVGLMLAGIAVFSLVCSLLLKRETAHHDLVETTPPPATEKITA